MTLLLKLAAASVAVVMAVASSAASAAIVTATYSGTVSGTGPIQPDGSFQTGGAFDATGEFGSPRLLDGLDFSAVFTFDTSLGFLDASSPGAEQYSGQFLSAVLTVDGFSRSFLSTTLGIALVASDGVDAASLHLALENSPDGLVGNFLQGFLYNPTLPLSLAGPFSGGYSVSEPTDPFHQNMGEFLIAELDPAAIVDLDDPVPTFLHFAHGYLAADHLTVTSSSAPEPATWGLMLIGFGGLGAMARRARRLGPPASA
jgi:hypothetical protein